MNTQYRDWCLFMWTLARPRGILGTIPNTNSHPCSVAGRSRATPISQIGKGRRGGVRGPGPGHLTSQRWNPGLLTSGQVLSNSSGAEGCLLQAQSVAAGGRVAAPKFSIFTHQFFCVCVYFFLFLLGSLTSTFLHSERKKEEGWAGGGPRKEHHCVFLQGKHPHRRSGPL